MHKLISIQQAMMSRDVTLKNVATKTEDFCFDNSAFPGYEYEGFYFMELGGTYDCKIELFGGLKSYCTSADRVLCHVLREDVVCGRVHMMEVKVGEDVYYIRRSELEGYQGEKEFYYYYTRKDLIQVNDVVNHHLLWGIE